MAVIRMLVGLPGSGKSTYAAECAQKNWQVISSDAIREQLYGDAACQDDPERVFSIACEYLTRLMDERLNIIIDATNLLYKNRKRFIEVIRSVEKKAKAYPIEAIVFAVPLEECKRRNAARNRVIPDEVIEKIERRFQMPFEKEGFDRVVIINDEQNIYPLEDIVALMSEQSQQRGKYCMEKLKERNKKPHVQIAGLLYDLGNEWTEDIDDKGKVTHYGAGNLAAYYVICHMSKKIKRAEVAQLLSYKAYLIRKQERKVWRYRTGKIIWKLCTLMTKYYNEAAALEQTEHE